MKVSQLQLLVNQSVQLRQPKTKTLQAYAEKMKAGAEFPPIEIGHWPKSEKYGEGGIVDGLNRLGAAVLAGLTDFPTKDITFKSLSDALTYGYRANMGHGVQVDEGSRNTRILLLRSLDPKVMTVDKLAKEFALSTSSIDRILKGQQGEGKSGPKEKEEGATKPKVETPMTCAVFLKTLAKVEEALQKKRVYASFIADMLPENKKGEVSVDDDAIALIANVCSHLNKILKDVAEQAKG